MKKPQTTILATITECQLADKCAHHCLLYGGKTRPNVELRADTEGQKYVIECHEFYSR